MIRVGIMGAGGIAITMAKTLNGMENANAYAVASRSREKAEKFAKENGIEKAYGSYEEMLADENVDLVYVATPHSHHYICCKMCLEAGKNVLCEKSFTVTADQARKLFDLAKEKNLLITEAIWTRYMPSRKMIDDLIASGVIGHVTSLTANLNYNITDKKRITDLKLAGGALLDVGVYPINFARMIFGDTMTECHANAVFKDGVDFMDNIAMVFEGDKMASLHSSVQSVSERNGMIYGTDGFIQVTNINNPEKITVYNKNYEETASYLPPKQITGYEYEVESCIKALEEGRLECPEMPHKETVKVVQIMENILRSWGYEIPIYE